MRYFIDLFGGLIRDAIMMVVAFTIGTGAGAILCWYYDLPLALSLVGGALVLGIALAVKSNSLFA